MTVTKSRALTLSRIEKDPRVFGVFETAEVLLNLDCTRARRRECGDLNAEENVRNNREEDI